MITEKQRNMLEYNDNQVKNFSRNEALKKKLEKERIDNILRRRNIKVKSEPRKIYLYDYWITHIEYDELNEEQIDREVAFGFDNYQTA